MSNANWWASKLTQGQPAVTPRPANNPMPPSQQPMAPYTPPQQNPNVSKAQSSLQIETCPECGSTNYMKIGNAAHRCYDCGYPIMQSGSRYGNLQGAKVEGNVKSAAGNDPNSNWNPQGIVGRIGE